MDHFLTDSSRADTFSDDLGPSKLKIFIWTPSDESTSGDFFLHWIAKL